MLLYEGARLWLESDFTKNGVKTFNDMLKQKLLLRQKEECEININNLEYRDIDCDCIMCN